MPRRKSIMSRRTQYAIHHNLFGFCGYVISDDIRTVRKQYPTNKGYTVYKLIRGIRKTTIGLPSLHGGKQCH